MPLPSFFLFPCIVINQDEVHRLFVSLAKLIQMDFKIKDTSGKGYLMNPLAKPDFTLLNGSITTWSVVVGVFEVKPFLVNSADYYEGAFGQVINSFELQKCASSENVFMFLEQKVSSENLH